MLLPTDKLPGGYLSRTVFKDPDSFHAVAHRASGDTRIRLLWYSLKHYNILVPTHEKATGMAMKGKLFLL